MALILRLILVLLKGVVLGCKKSDRSAYEKQKAEEGSSSITNRNNARTTKNGGTIPFQLLNRADMPTRHEQNPKYPDDPQERVLFILPSTKKQRGLDENGKQRQNNCARCLGMLGKNISPTYIANIKHDDRNRLNRAAFNTLKKILTHDHGMTYDDSYGTKPPTGKSKYNEFDHDVIVFTFRGSYGINDGKPKVA